MKVTNSQERLKELLAYYKINQNEFCKRTGLTKSVVSLYVQGKREPRQDKLSLIADAYNVDPAWLMGYDVPMKQCQRDYVINSDSDPIFTETNKCNTDEAIILNAYINSDSLTKQMVKKILGIE